MAETVTVSRYDMYRPIHKGLRAFMADTLTAVGAMDDRDAADVAAVLERVRALLGLCAGHVEHENDHVHPALEARAPGSSGIVAADHDHHRQHIAALRGAVAAVETAHGPARAAAAHALYRRLAAFVGENLVHMEEEESVHNTVLWRHYSDDALRAIEGAIVAALPPEEMMLILRWVVPALTPAERAELLGGLRAAMPADVFVGILDMVWPHLRPGDGDKLMRALAASALAA